MYDSDKVPIRRSVAGRKVQDVRERNGRVGGHPEQAFQDSRWSPRQS
jgi:hypothetical protein